MIESVIFFFSGSGVVMLFILFMRINVVGSKSKLVKHRSKEPGFVDLLIYASVVDEGVIVGKDGSLMAAWAYQGVDSKAARKLNATKYPYKLTMLYHVWVPVG